MPHTTAYCKLKSSHHQHRQLLGTSCERCPELLTRKNLKPSVLWSQNRTWPCTLLAGPSKSSTTLLRAPGSPETSPIHWTLSGLDAMAATLLLTPADVMSERCTATILRCTPAGNRHSLLSSVPNSVELEQDAWTECLQQTGFVTSCVAQVQGPLGRVLVVPYLVSCMLNDGITDATALILGPALASRMLQKLDTTMQKP
jgi:hypothetical protein